MRILSPSEYQSLHLVSDVPVELSANYFPICLRLFTKMDGEITFRGESDRSKNLLEEVALRINCQRISREVPSKSSEYIYRNRVVDSVHYYTLAQEGERRENSYQVEYSMFPVDNLLFEKDLSAYSITPIPGRLYFQANMTLSADTYSGNGIFGSRYLDEGYLQFSRFSSWETEHSNKLPIARDSEEQNWRGPVADIEQLTNSRVVHQQFFRNRSLTAEYILETPLDFPPGFVQETLNVFTRRWNKISKTAKKFCDLVLGSPLDETPPEAKIEAKRSRKRAKEADVDKATESESPFPQGISRMRGPDSSWQRCSEPWFVQSVILARLIGGRYWQYALGYLESKLGRSL